MSGLFDELNSYSSTTFPEPRPFQVVAHERLRQGLRDGHRCQMFLAPTKTGTCLAEGPAILMVGDATKLAGRSDPSTILARIERARLPRCYCLRIPAATSKLTVATVGEVRAAG